MFNKITFEFTWYGYMDFRWCTFFFFFFYMWNYFNFLHQHKLNLHLTSSRLFSPSTYTYKRIIKIKIHIKSNEWMNFHIWKMRKAENVNTFSTTIRIFIVSQQLSVWSLYIFVLSDRETAEFYFGSGYILCRKAKLI